jgi:hypothetical protein
MKNSINLSRTGDFWIDIGLISLWKILSSRSSKNPVSTSNGLRVEVSLQDDLYSDSEALGVILTLSSDSLLLEFDDYKILNEELYQSLEFTKPYYSGKTKDGTKDSWQRLGRYFFKNLNPVNIFFETPVTTIEKSRGKWRIGKCEFCSTPERYVKPLGSVEHPLVVVPNKFSSFYSNLAGNIKICNWCAFASKFTPIRLFYIMSRNSINMIALECNNLNDLLFVFNNFSRLFIQSDTYRNFPKLMKFVQYPLESFLDFLFTTITEMGKKQDLEGKNLIRSALISKVHVIQASISGGLSIDKYYVIPNMPKVFDFISTCNWKSKTTQKSYNSLIETAKSLISRRGDDIETIVREEFARRIFYNKDVSDLIEEFLITNFEKRSSTKYFESINIDKFITLYYLNQMGMDSTQLYISKQLGEIIGTLAAKYGNKSLLYNLRSIGNLDTLLSFFNQMLVRYIDDINVGVKNIESLLYNIENSNWFRYKSLIGIFSVLSYTELITNNQEKVMNA